MLRIGRSICYALRGIGYGVKSQLNMKIHLLAAVLVVVAGFYWNLSPAEAALLSITIFMVLAAELFNTSIEKLVDLVSPEQHPIAGIVKDTAAGAVLLSAINALVVAYLLLWPRLSTWLF